jgi:hypothetical protein
MVRRWARRLAVLVVLAVVAYLLRTPLLRAAGGLLVADDGPAACTRLLVLDGDRRHEFAADAVTRGQAEGVLLVRRIPRRTQALGIVPTSEELARRELARRGVSADRVEMLPGEAGPGWDWARLLGDWLGRHPQATVLVATDRFATARDRIVLRRTLTPSQFARVRLAGLPHREFDESNWWQVKGGGLAFGHGLLRLTYTWINGEGDPGPEPKGPDELEEVGR